MKMTVRRRRPLCITARAGVLVDYPHKIEMKGGLLARVITHVSERLYGDVEFHSYALTDGIAAHFRRYGTWRKTRTTTPPGRTRPHAAGTAP